MTSSNNHSDADVHLCVCAQVLLDKQFTGSDVTTGSFLSLKPRLISVLIGALQTESNASNIQVILGQSQILVLFVV